MSNHHALRTSQQEHLEVYAKKKTIPFSQQHVASLMKVVQPCRFCRGTNSAVLKLQTERAQRSVIILYSFP